MMRFLQTLCLLLLISFGAAAQIPAQTIPQFTFSRLDKTPFSAKDLAKGQKLLFIFFDTECEHCQRTISYLGEHYTDIKSTPIYLVTLDNQEKIAGFMNKYGAKLKGKKNITLLQDTNKQFIVIFQPRKYPSMFLYSAEKKLLDYEDNDESVFRILSLIKGKTK